MEFMLDTACLKDIKRYNQIIPLAGVTTNPSIMKKEEKVDFFKHMREIRNIIGKNGSLHIQVVASDYEGMMNDAKAILENVDQDVYIKVPVSKEGLQVIKELKKQGKRVSATTVYTTIQGQLAIAAGADFVIPYFNRMENLNINPQEVLESMTNDIKHSQSNTKILAASFKHVGQVIISSNCGVHAVTVGTDILDTVFAMPSIDKAVNDFTKDWESSFGRGTRIHNL